MSAWEFASVAFVWQALAYFGLASLGYLLFWKWSPESMRRYKLQAAAPRRGQISREIFCGLGTLMVTSALAVLIWRLDQRGLTRFHASGHGPLPGWLQFLIINLLNDTYFYWTHRLLHHPILMRFHRIHHSSVTPTPFSTLAFHPIEALVNFGFFPLVALLIPCQPEILAAYYVFLVFLNVNGHLGFEIFPRNLFKLPVVMFFNNATHHDLHHTKPEGNFGLYYDFWDRICGTEHAGYRKRFLMTAAGQALKSPSSQS